jgi:NADP-dependent 3-hydroxy acid dehydrogenase YdfG
MKIVITGHTSGLGKALYENFSKDHDVLGLSRETGHDLRIDLCPFIIDNFDVYINNAYSGYAQVDLLYQIFDKNKYRNCTIINVGSVSADGNRDTVNEYAIHKAALEKACSQLQLIDTDCRVVHLKLGRMNTPMTDHKSEYPRMNTNYVADAIEWIVNQPKNILVKNLTLDIMHSRRKETL